MSTLEVTLNLLEIYWLTRCVQYYPIHLLNLAETLSLDYLILFPEEFHNGKIKQTYMFFCVLKNVTFHVPLLIRWRPKPISPVVNSLSSHTTAQDWELPPQCTKCLQHKVKNSDYFRLQLEAKVTTGLFDVILHVSLCNPCPSKFLTSSVTVFRPRSDISSAIPLH